MPFKLNGFLVVLLVIQHFFSTRLHHFLARTDAASDHPSSCYEYPRVWKESVVSLEMLDLLEKRSVLDVSPIIHTSCHWCIALLIFRVQLDSLVLLEPQDPKE